MDLYHGYKVSKQENISELSRWLKRGMVNGNSNIKRIIVIRNNKVVEITRKQLDKKDFSKLDPLK